MNIRGRHVRLLLLAVMTLIAVACNPPGAENNSADAPAADQANAQAEQQGDPAATVVDDAGASDDADSGIASEEPKSNEVETPTAEDGAYEDEAAASEEEASNEKTEEKPVDGNGADSSERNVTENEETDADNETPAEDEMMTEDNRNERQRIISADWNTDWNRHTVPYEELLALLPVRDGIPAIDNPVFISPEEAADWLAEAEPVIAFEANGDARAYPLQIMTYHEIVNDNVGDLPVAATFCPLCNSAIVFDRRLDEQVYDFGTSGWLRHSDLVMYDRQTESLWQQFTGEGIVGQLAGEQLTLLPSSIVSFADFREAFPRGQILSRDTGHQRPYGQNPYPGYDTVGQNPFAFVGVPDGRLAAMERVITVSLSEVDVAYSLTELIEMGVINDTQGGQDLVIFHTGGTASALDSPVIAQGADVGATGVFDPNLNGQKLSFSKDGKAIVDDQTGSTWNILGQAVDGPLAGERLTPIIHGDYFWFAWAAFQPDTIIYGS